MNLGKYLSLVSFSVALFGCGSTFSATSVEGDGGANCLANIPVTCPDCVTENPSDEPACKTYLLCFEGNHCNPTDPCGQANGVCSVNSIGGGSAPQAAAAATYMCACAPQDE